MLEELSKNHGKWIKYAIKICGHKQSAEDLVQDMYLKVHNRNIESYKLTDQYIYTMLLNDYKTIVTKGNKVELISIDEGYMYNNSSQSKGVRDIMVKLKVVTPLRVEYCDNGIDDDELKIIDKFKKLTDKEQRILISTVDNSLRSIAEQEDTYPIDIFWIVRNARIKILRNKYFK